MLILELSVNGKLIGRSTARRIEPVGRPIKKNEVCTYILNEAMESGHYDTHNYSDGAKVLAQVLLDKMVILDEPKRLKKRGKK